MWKKVSHFHDKTMWKDIHDFLFTYMAIIHPYTMTIISTSAFDNVIGVIRLSNLVIGVNYNLSESENRQHKELITMSVSKNQDNMIQKNGTKIILFRKCHYYLEYVVSWFNICNVHPLAVNIMSVCIPAAHCDPLLTKVCALVSLLNSL